MASYTDLMLQYSTPRLPRANVLHHHHVELDYIHESEAGQAAATRVDISAGDWLRGQEDCVSALRCDCLGGNRVNRQQSALLH